MNHPFVVDLLLVEDNRADAELTLVELAQHPEAGFIFHVHDGEEALEFLLAKGRYGSLLKQATRPKVILLDIKMPRLNGIELLERLKQLDETRSIPVVMLTASNESPDLKKCFELGASAYIVKPLTFDHFNSAIEALENYWVPAGHV